MKRLINHISMFLFIGCLSINNRELVTAAEKLSEDVSEKDGSSSLSGELVVSELWDMGVFNGFIEKFMEKYPDVTVRTEALSDQDSYYGSDMESMLEIKTKIMTGECGDIVCTEVLDSRQCGEQGLFEDLYEWMEADPDFRREDYFSSMFKAFETDGRLYQFTLQAIPAYFKLNRKFLDDAGAEHTGDTISFWEMADLYDQVQAVEENPVYLTNLAWAAAMGTCDMLGGLEMGYFVENNAFHTSEYMEYLMRNHKMTSSLELRYASDPLKRAEGSELPHDDDLSVLVASLYPMSDYEKWNQLFQEGTEVTKAFRYEGLHGERPLISYLSLSISSFSKNKELAWEFLKFIMSEEDCGTSDYPTYIPMNKKKAMRVCADISTEVRERLFSDLEEGDTTYYANEEVIRSLAPIYHDYYIYNIIDEEECVRQLEERVYLYLHE